MFQTIRWWAFFLIAIYIGGLLTAFPIPQDWQWFRPHWLLVFFIYCQVVYPNHFNPILAWVGGLLVDSLLETRLGEHALVFAVICYLTALLRPKFLLRPLWQQFGKVSLLVCFAQILILWFHAITGQNPHTLLYWMGTVTSCVFWIFMSAFLQAFRPQKLTQITSRSI